MSDIIPKFEVKVCYEDGNSFNTYKDYDTLPYVWSDFSKAKKAFDAVVNSSHRDSTIDVELDDGSVQPVANFWSHDYFQRLESVEIIISNSFYEV
ncbi:hypothetical protein PQC36_gp121 [Proteus phage Vb_PmiP-P59]|uniref:Uncharacterized protein n=3 Tax=Privateervirus TaxID=2843440 RepID=A0A7L7SSR3_9CAUD|nr:RNA ligase 1 [Cronobacter phage vB_CsaP_009]YP_010672248.1 hypothetical protein PQC36_gp121 [Proteus phage Vb_PmiP-P59]YP_010672365.1 hypothetical protein PQC37_gp102 [Proteus phage 3H10_20]QMV48291.1 hypothetical protein [Proteus phage Vb_PmiP-P59]QOC54888.1 hypothetical protein [Proteus phage 3H10_20]BBU72679.1 RNA ligase 1 [Cronobacter phage vB_CsaP_009]